MTSNEIIAKIKTRGYWRIVFEPLEFIPDKYPISDCKELVNKNKVSMRGWDYPHYPVRQDDDSKLEPGNNYWQGWIDWERYKEFWRFYQSGQFVHYLGVREDWSEDIIFKNMWEQGDRTIKPGEALGVVSTTFLMTEIFHFLSRLMIDGVYQTGVKVKISLINTSNRQLFIESFDRVPFTSPRTTAGSELNYEITLSKGDLLTDINKAAEQVIVFFYKRFGWDPPNIEVIKSDQEKLVSGRL